MYITSRSRELPIQVTAEEFCPKVANKNPTDEYVSGKHTTLVAEALIALNETCL